MTETKNPGEKTLTVTPSKTTLSLKRSVEQGMVRQSFSHGRTKAVVVEKLKRRVVGPGEAKAGETAAAAPATTARRGPAQPAARDAAGAPAAGGKLSGVVLRELTQEEHNARAHALAGAKAQYVEERRIAVEAARQKLERDKKAQEERVAAEERKREEDDRRRHEEEAKQKAETTAKKRFGEEETKAKPPTPATPTISLRHTTVEADEEEAPRTARRGPGAARPVPPPKPTRGGAEKRRGRLTLVTALSADEERERSVASFRRRTQRLKGHASNEPKEKLVREVTIPEAITIQELANRMSERAVDVIKLLMKQGQMAKITDMIDADTAQLIAEELGHSVRRVAESDVEEGLFDVADDPAHLLPRPPVVTIMGHVDHGKTSLLDAIRKTDVAAGEAGGITQHIGAYQVELPSGEHITFIDTPGHEAFTAMRARGASVTDIVVLVVAADDGVMPQTIEAIRHAKAAHAPLIVAINKMDKPDANPQRVRQELLSHEVVVEEMGGETQDVEVSALKKTGLDKLTEAIVLQAEILDLKANPNRSAEGTVIESRLDRGRGPIATVLVQKGTLHQGEIVVAGAEWGKVRAMLDDKGRPLDAAGPSMPVEILGLAGIPSAGEPLVVVEDESRAREITEFRARRTRDKAAGVIAGARGTLDEMLARIQAGVQKEVAILIKADVQGSAEAIQATVMKQSGEEVKVRVLLAGVGQITESDIQLAKASEAVVVAFNVRATAQARDLAQREGVDIRYYSIIYEVADDIEKLVKGKIAPKERERFLGYAEVRQVFTITKVGKVAGCMVTDGLVKRGAGVRVLRDNVVIHTGELSQLKRFKDDVREVARGYECGLSFANFHDLQEGDVVECYETELVPA